MYKVCLIGHGYWGSKLARNFHVSEFFKLTAVVDKKASNLKVVKKKCWFILEHSQYISFEENKSFKESKKYGNVNFSIFENNE